MKKLFLFFVFLVLTRSALAAPAVQEVVSPGGIKAWLMQSDRLPLISLQFAFRGGVEQDPTDRQGLAMLTAALLTQGAGPYDDRAFQEKLAENAISLDIGAGRDALTGSLKTLRKTKKEAFRLLALALTEPRFEKESFERLKNQQQTSIQFQLSDPDWQARYALFRLLFGEHPYGYRSLGTKETLATIQKEDVLSFARDHLAKNNLVVAVVGDITPRELSAALDEIFGNLPAKAAQRPIPPFVWPEKPLSVLVPRTGTQTNILLAAPMMKRQDPDWHAAQIANYILGGGGFVSRLMKEVREKNGLTYGIRTALGPMDKASLLIGEMAADNDKTAQALSLTKKVWHAFFEKGVTEEEVEAAKAYLTGSLPLALGSTGQVASILLSLQLDNQPRDYLTEREALLKAVSAKDVNRVIKCWFNPAHLWYAFAGNPEHIQADRTSNLIGE